MKKVTEDDINNLFGLDASGESFTDALKRVVACDILCIDPPIQPKFYIKSPYSNITMEDLTKENVAPIIWQYGSDFKISSEDAAKKIREEMENKFSGSVSFNASKENQIVGAVREYRKGQSLESISQKIVDIAETFSLDLTTDNNFDFSPFTSLPLNGILGGVFCNQSVGDIVYTTPKDSTWVECNGQFLSSVDYPDLYQFLSNCNWDPNWGKRAQMGTANGAISFKIPDIQGAWIKAKN